MLLLLIRNAIAYKLFTPSIYDFRVDPQERAYEGYFGFLNKHFYVPDSNHFGELGIITLNTHIENDTSEVSQKRIILGLIDTHHPTILSLQGLVFDELDEIISKSEGHYEAACKAALNNDVWRNRLEAMPILYDSSSIIKIKESVFEPKEYQRQAYGCAAVFYSKITEQIFTIVNVDLPSVDEKVVDSQVFNILENMENSKYRDLPVFVTGTVNTKSERLRRLIEKTFLNLNDFDRNNVGLSKTTFHNYGKIEDNIQRDYVLLRDKGGKLKVNYSRILNRFSKDYFEHYPIYVIMSRK